MTARGTHRSTPANSEGTASDIPAAAPSFGTLRYEHLFRGYIGDGDALGMEVHRFRIIYNTIRPRQALADRNPQTGLP